MKNVRNSSRYSFPRRKRWVVTGAAGFIGSHLVESLLLGDQEVIGLDNFSTGNKENLIDIERAVGEKKWRKFKFYEGDTRDPDICNQICAGADIVLHQAALGSVPRSITNPLETNDVNVSGFLNILIAAKNRGVRRVVYASSSSVYGNDREPRKVEHRTGEPLSPYAVTKVVNELHAKVFSKIYDIQVIGLRYFNVFGPRQNPDGVYSAVIPRWIKAMIEQEPVIINGDGETSRDFCFIKNVIQANFLAAETEHPEALNQVYNVAVGESTSLLQLYSILKSGLTDYCKVLDEKSGPHFAPFRQGDVKHSLADITKSIELLGYDPEYRLMDGIRQAIPWYISR